METWITPQPHPVTLQVPEHLRYQLVYQKPFTRSAHQNSTSNDLLVTNALEACSQLPLLQRTFGVTGTIKIILKTLTGRRLLYGAILNRKLAHHGWFSVGFCKHYHVEKEDIVIGSIWTDKAARGKKLATRTIQHAMQRILQESSGERTFHIDTAWDNLPCQKVIEKLGFGPPVALYIRGKKPAR